VARRRARGRNINGIVLLDKPVGLSSNAALQEAKRLFFARKAGHTGSLDPLASGLLPLCFGEATKLSAFLLDADKVYEGTCQLGVRTTTADAEGEIIDERPVPELSDAQIEAVLEKFTGQQQQVPPMHSAVKVKGQPLYKLAHQGLEVEREPRTVQVYSLKLVSYEPAGGRFDFVMHCSKGTYVRTLAEDIGEALGCGAHLSRLCRTAVGPLELDKAVSLDRLREVREAEGAEALGQFLLPMDQALVRWPALKLTEHSAYYVRQGQPVQVAKAPTSGWVRLFADNDRFLGVGQILDDGRVAPRRLVSGG
jgi:tRNA pseudouridine55 synthase